MQVSLRLKPNEGPTNLNLTVARDMKPAVASAVTKNWEPRPGSPSQSRSYAMGYALRLELGNLRGNSVPGKLYLSLPDAERTVVAGVFEATLPAYGLSAVQNPEDWPQWRGPLRNGVALVSPPLANSWPSGAPKLLWRTERLMNNGKGTGHSSPVVAGGRVYLYGYCLDSDATGGAYDEVACLDAGSGSLLWRTKLPAWRARDAQWQSSTPSIVNGRLYVWGRRPAYCLDTKDGKVLWQQTFSNGEPSSFAVLDGIAILICKGFYGFDAVTGEVRWNRSDAESRWSSSPSPVFWWHEGKNYALCAYKNVELMDPSTGEAIWKLPWVKGNPADSGRKGNSTPAVVGDYMVVAQTADGTTMEGYKLSLEGPRKLWQVAHHDSGTSPLIYNGYVYTVGGGDYGKPTSMRCVELQTGRVAWEQFFPKSEGQGCSSPIAADGKIFGYLKFGKLLCMWKADPNHCILLGTATVGAEQYSSLAFAQGRLFVRLPDGVACYDVTAGGQ